MFDPERDYTDSDLAALEAQELKRLQDFSLGEPALVCRWRLADRALPLRNRHLRALAARKVQGRPLTPEFLAWVRQHLEQTLTGGAAEHPDGVLMLVQDVDGHAVMSVGAYCSLADRSARALADRALASRQEASEAGVAPETLWAARGQTLLVGLDPGSDPSGAATLVLDLASTLGIPVSFSPGLAADVRRAVDVLEESEKRSPSEKADTSERLGTWQTSEGPENPPTPQPPDLRALTEVFLVSDEHGVVPASDRPGPLGERLASAYQTLRDRTRRGC